MNLKEPVISTERLELHHIAADRLIDLFEKRDDTFALVGETFTNPLRNLIDFQGPLAWRVPQVKADPATNKWFVRWIVLKENREIIGSTSFHGAPDAQGMMEIGLGIETQYQNQGYAKEAPGMGSTAAKAAGAGIVVGGLLGLVTGSNTLQSAGTGAVIGGAGGAYKGNESQEAVVKKCLVGRGYKVLN